MADVIYNRFLMGIFGADYDLAEAGDDVKAALTTSAYVPNIDTHLDFGDVTNQLSGTGYTANGESLGVQTVTQDDTDNEGVFDANDVTWTAIDAGTADSATLHSWTGTAGTSLLICNIDTGGFPIVTNGGDLTIQWNSEGILNSNQA